MSESSLHFVLLLADAAMLSLIGAVQWLIYPSFRYFENERLIAWHHRYTVRIGLLVVPLMTTQLGVGAYRCWTAPTLPNFAYAIIIVLLWGLTFTIFVPLHQKIADGRAEDSDLRKLVRHNGARTALWSLAFVCNLLLWYAPFNP